MHTLGFMLKISKHLSTESRLSRSVMGIDNGPRSMEVDPVSPENRALRPDQFATPASEATGTVPARKARAARRADLAFQRRACITYGRRRQRQAPNLTSKVDDDFVLGLFNGSRFSHADTRPTFDHAHQSVELLCSASEQLVVFPARLGGLEQSPVELPVVLDSALGKDEEVI